VEVKKQYQVNILLLLSITGFWCGLEHGSAIYVINYNIFRDILGYYDLKQHKNYLMKCAQIIRPMEAR